MTDRILDLLEKFDFEKAHALFVFMGWKYGSNETPTIGELQKNAMRLLHAAIESADGNDGYGVAECGRFVATYSKEEGELELKLMFESQSVYV